MKYTFLVIAAMLALGSCGAEEVSDQDGDRIEIGLDQEALSGTNPFTCLGTCLVCTKRDPTDKRRCLQYSQRRTAKNICSGYTTVAKAISDCRASMPSCSGISVSIGNFTCQ